VIDWIFTNLTLAMSGNFGLALIAAVAWGILSILLSPCHLSSIPLVVGFITSQSQGGEIKMTVRRSFWISLVFGVGILITIAAIGLITAAMGRMMGDVGRAGNYIVAAVFFIVGLYLLDVIPLNWGGLPISSIRFKGLAAALGLGLIFGIGLGPCTFAYMAPVLGVVYTMSDDQIGQAILLLFAFGIGHCSVIVFAGTVSKWVQSYLNWSEESKIIVWIKRFCGLLVIFGGMYMIYTTF